ncbi:MAG TPA: hypothetical protein VLX85_05195 [Stellaceae bacterium]|nr:hypothetical protein [Stellaceae bacterium]
MWRLLADLLFLDTETLESEFRDAADALNHAGWTRAAGGDRAHRVGGAHVGYLVYPVIGEWVGFDATGLVAKVRRRQALRKRLPRWWFWLADRDMAWIIRALGAERLLTRLCHSRGCRRE